ncbi:MAG: dihydropyrimidinase [Alphaproteobacteria bacterium]
MTYDTIIKGATVATAADTIRCDIGIKDGRVAVLAEDLPESEAENCVDASGLLALPGGVDAHVHLAEDGYGGLKMADGFETGSISAACGGTTTMIPFVTQKPGISLRQAVEAYHEKAKDQSVIDYAFHLIVTDPTEQVLGQDLPALLEDGYTSFKVYMTYEGYKVDDGQMLSVLAAARSSGGFVMVHAENDHCIQWLTAELERAGDTHPSAFTKAHGPVVEREATHRAISLAEIVDTPVYIVHVSAAGAMDQIAWAQGQGLPVYAETCPQYLFLSHEDFEKAGWDATKCLCSPPPRDAGNPDQLWRGIANGTFQVVSSDHCPYRVEGPGGKIEAAKGELHFDKVSPGVPGIETRMPLMYSEGVGKGRIDLNRFVAVTATNPAKLFGLYPRKGTIAVGSDADIALWDPEKTVTITNGMQHSGADYTPYEGRTVTGYPVTTIVRGEIVWSDGAPTGKTGGGQFLRCGKSEAVTRFRNA